MLVYLVTIGLLISLFTSSPAAPHAIQAVRSGWHGTFVRIVFDIQGDIPYDIVTTAEATKIVVAFPGVAELPTPHIGFTGTPIIKNISFVKEADKVAAEIALQRAGTVQKHYRMRSPARIVVDIGMQTPAAPQQRTQTTTPAERGREPVASAPAVAPPAVAVMSLGSQEGTDKRPPQDGRPPPPQQASKEPPGPQEGKGQPVPEVAARQSLPVPPPSSETAMNTQSETELLHAAERQWQQGQFRAAYGSYQKFLERFPDHPHNHLIAVRLADMLQNQQQYRTALEGYADVISTYPGSEGALISTMRMAELGIQHPDLLSRDGDIRLKAYHYPIDSLRMLIQKYPLSPLADVARFKIAVFQLQRRQVSTAMVGFQELLGKPLKEELRQEVKAKYRAALQALITERQNQGQHAEVLQVFFAHKAELSPQEAESPDFLLPLAISYAHLGLLPEAQSLFEAQKHVTGTSPPHGPMVLEQANVLAAQGLLQEAKNLLKSAVSSAQGTARDQMFLTLGKLALQTSQPQEAVQYLRKGLEVVSSAPERAMLLALLGEGYAAQGQKPEGLQAFQQCVKIATAAEPSPFPTAETCLFRAAGLLFSQRQYQAALQMYKQLLAAFPQTMHREWVLLRMATIARELTDTEQMQQSLNTLRDSSTSSLWQKVANDALEEAAWQQQFHERLAEFQNNLLR